jgi:hypothetical protein
LYEEVSAGKVSAVNSYFNPVSAIDLESSK